MSFPTLFTKPIETLTQEDVLTAIGWPESLNVEFKEALPGRNGRPDAWMSGGTVESYAKDKLWREVVAFANTTGGHLVLGVQEGDGPAPLAVGIAPIPRCILLAEQLARAAQSIDPPIPLLLVQGIPIADDAGIVLFRVPGSRSAPHRAPDLQCYVRRGTESTPMGMREIQDMTLAVGRREEQTDAFFLRASAEFASWAESHGAQMAFRVTSVPIGAGIDLGRVYGRKELHDLKRYFVVEDTRWPGQKFQAPLPMLPDRSISLVRRNRLIVGGENDHGYFDIHSSGVVDFCYSFSDDPEDSRMYIGWLVCCATNVLVTTEKVRVSAGFPDTEYGVEIELLGKAKPIDLVDWVARFHQKVGGIAANPLKLPRISFGPVSEINEVLTVAVNDVFDAAGAGQATPIRISVDLSH